MYFVGPEKLRVQPGMMWWIVGLPMMPHGSFDSARSPQVRLRVIHKISLVTAHLLVYPLATQLHEFPKGDDNLSHAQHIKELLPSLSSSLHPLYFPHTSKSTRSPSLIVPHVLSRFAGPFGILCCFQAGAVASTRSALP